LKNEKLSIIDTLFPHEDRGKTVCQRLLFTFDEFFGVGAYQESRTTKTFAYSVRWGNKQIMAAQTMKELNLPKAIFYRLVKRAT